MKTRLELDLFVDELTKEELSFLSSLKAKSVNIENQESKASHHLCGHDEGKPCKKEVLL